MSQRIAIIGDGAMGTLCAMLLSENGHVPRMWSAFEHVSRELAQRRENVRYLPGFPLPDAIELTARDDEAFEGAELAISAVPTQFVRRVWERLGGVFPDEMPVCSVAKGVEIGTLLRPTEIVADTLAGAGKRAKLAALSGPSIAPEIAAGLPATVAVASDEPGLAEIWQALLSGEHFRVYTNPDRSGLELAGATKNVIAIAAGILDGLETGCNAKAALFTRGLAEITRLGTSMGAHAETFAGLGGAGDLVTTCISPIGRNRGFGERIGRGMSVDEALAATESVVEGVATSKAVLELATRYGVEMPITAAVEAIIDGRLTPSRALHELMTRPLKSEC